MDAGLQRAHLELAGQGEGLAVVALGLADRGGLGERLELAHEAPGPRLMPALLLPEREVERALGHRACAVELVRGDQTLAQVRGPEREVRAHPQLLGEGDAVF